MFIRGDKIVGEYRF